MGRLDTKVNKGCTVTAQPWYGVEASHQLPAGVQSRLMGSKKALRKRGNFRNSKTVNSWSHVEGCLILGKTALDSMQMASQGALYWGTGDLLGMMRATDRWRGWGTRVCYPTKPGVAKEGECRPKEASQSS